MEYQKLGNVIQYVRNFEELQRSITVFIQTTRYIIDHNGYGIYLKMIRIFSLPVSNSSRVIYYVVLIYFFKPLLGLSRILIYRGNISFNKNFVVFFFFYYKTFHFNKLHLIFEFQRRQLPEKLRTSTFRSTLPCDGGIYRFVAQRVTGKKENK